jgi:CheY-like chemotaxis protein
MLDATDTMGAPVELLVVEDDDAYRSAMCELLAEEGYRVEAANDGSVALTRLRAGLAPALIVLDLKMPVMDGWGFMAELKKDPERASIPVLVVTGAGERVLFSAPVSAGYIGKPFDRKQFLQMIARCLLKARSR